MTKDAFEHLLPGHEDEMQRWRRENEPRKSEPPPSETQVIKQLRDELQELRDARQEDQKTIAELVATISNVLENLPQWMEGIARKSHDELRGLIAERFGELTGQIRALDGKAKADFKFAGEDDWLPNPLARRDH